MGGSDHGYQPPTVESDEEWPELKKDPYEGASVVQDWRRGEGGSKGQPDLPEDQQRVFVTDSSGKRFAFPFALARTWTVCDLARF